MLKNRSEGADRVRTEPRLLAKVLRIEWLGQTVASVCWICSVLAYGINATGDWLQLFAASAWLVANIAAIGTVELAPTLRGGDA